MPPQQSAVSKPVEKMSDGELHTAGLEQAKNKEQGKSFDAGLLESLRTERQRRLDAGEWSHPDRSSSSSPSKPTAGKSPAPVEKKSQEAGKGANAGGCLGLIVVVLVVLGMIGAIAESCEGGSDSGGPASGAGPDTYERIYPDKSTLKFVDHQEVHLHVSNAGPGNAHYSAIVHYKIDEGNPTWPYSDKDLYVEYCSDYPIAPGPTRIIVLEMNHKYSTKESKWLQYRGKFQYSLDKAYRNPHKCAP